MEKKLHSIREKWLIGVLSCISAPCALAAEAEAELEIKAALERDYCAEYFQKAEQGGIVEPQQQAVESEGPEQPHTQRLIKSISETGVRVAAQASNEKACKKSLAKGLKRYTGSRDKRNRKGPSLSHQKFSESAEIAAVQQRVFALWVNDQSARQVYVDLRTEEGSGDQLWAGQLATAEAVLADLRSAEAMRELMTEYGWLDAHRFGGPTSNRAWLLIQHADRDPELQLQALDGMQGYLADGGVAKENYAFLWDRVAVNHKRLQRYGTQPIWECENGKLNLAPLEAPDQLDRRRMEMGLGPVDAALAAMEQHFCR
jgi:hypothetical protein